MLGTLHTGNAARTLDRVLDVFPTDQREQIRIMVSESLARHHLQQLIPRADGTRPCLALEILVNTPAVGERHPRRQDLHASRDHADRQEAGNEPDGRLTRCNSGTAGLISAGGGLCIGPNNKTIDAGSALGIDIVPTMPYIDQFFQALIQRGASDLHLGEGQPPKIRAPRRNLADSRRGAHPRGNGLHDERDLRSARAGTIRRPATSISPTRWMKDSRFRCNYLKQVNGYGRVFRIIPTKIVTLENFGIPPVVKEFGHMRGGLVLVTGPTGSGKIHDARGADRLHQHQFSRHIITVEEPIEFVHSQQAKHHHPARSAGTRRQLSRRV